MSSEKSESPAGFPHQPSTSPSPSPPASRMKNGSSDCEESSSISTSSQGNTSMTFRDAQSNCSNGYVNSLGGGTSDREKQEEKTKAVFDKVVLDAMQRQHIRTKHKRSKEDDSGSDSSSGIVEMPLHMKHEGKMRVEQKRTPLHIVFQKNSSSDTGISSGQADRVTPQQLLTNFGHSSRLSRHSFRGHANLKRAFHRTQDKYRPEEDASDSGEEMERKRKRFYRTFTALRECGLMEITLQTASLMEKNRQVQKQIMLLRKETSHTYNQMLQLCKDNPNFEKSQNTKEAMQNLTTILSETSKAP